MTESGVSQACSFVRRPGQSRRVGPPCSRNVVLPSSLLAITTNLAASPALLATAPWATRPAYQTPSSSVEQVLNPRTAGDCQQADRPFGQSSLLTHPIQERLRLGA